MIFHRVYALSRSRIPVKRLWINSLEDKAIRDGLENMKADAEYKKCSMRRNAGPGQIG